MTAFDWLLLSILAYSILRASLRGIILEIFLLAGLILGLLLAAWNYPQIALLIERIGPGVRAAQPIAFLVILAAVVIVTAITGKLLHRGVHAAGLGLFDRVLGAFFGLVRGCLFAVALVACLTIFAPASSWVRNSCVSPYFLAGAHAVSFVVPHDLQQQILDRAASFKHTPPDWIKPSR